ncbi:MAG: sensor domain-containing diguanylate cyclase [Deltaproteobacteria bacterium]|nr:sensor domain-containing diguanylate cyclase [Deltaproteobacteria bacterium]
MKDKDKTKDQLINELKKMRQRINELKALETERKQAEEALRESEEKLVGIVSSVTDHMSMIDEQHNILWANDVAKSLFGANIVGKKCYTTYHRCDKVCEPCIVEKCFKDGKIHEHETKVITANGREMDFWCTASVAARYEDGRPKIVVEVSRDITERKSAKELLQKEKETFFSMLQKAPYGVVLIDKDGEYLYINPEFTRITGYTLQDVPTEKDWFYKAYPDPKYRKKVIGTWKRDFAQMEVDRVFSVVCKDREVKEIEFKPTLLEDGRVIVTLSDVTERKRAEQQLAYMATHDPLTGLPNRMLFNDRLTLALAHAQRKQQKLAMMLLDLDRFKEVNDTLGHSAGDKLLQAVGDRLARLLRKSDTVARMGGDEFLLLLPEIVRMEYVAKIAQKILEAFREPFVLDDHKLHITTSIGIAIYPEDGEYTDTLMKNADIAMYRAKQKGRDNYQRYTPAMTDKSVE